MNPLASEGKVTRQRMCLISILWSLIMGSKCCWTAKALCISEMMAGCPNRGTAVWVFLFYFVFLDLIWILLLAICTGLYVAFAASISCKGSYWFHYRLWMWKCELAKCCSYWSYVHVILRNWMGFFSEILLRKYMDDIKDPVLTKCFYLYFHLVICPCVYWMLNIL